MDYLNDQTSPLVKRVCAFEQLQRVQKYLFDTTYGTPLQGITWEQWYNNVQQAVQLLRNCETTLRITIAQRLGAEVC